jgi:hypothetical protein
MHVNREINIVRELRPTSVLVRSRINRDLVGGCRGNGQVQRKCSCVEGMCRCRGNV